MSGNSLVRSLHDLSAAAWFGGSLMGAVGLNGAASDLGRADVIRFVPATGPR